ncbi:MAG: Fic family protein [Lapillicoccus sp.]
MANIETLADTPLLPEVAQEMHLVSLVRGALATTAIEGNTMTEEEARLAVEQQLKLPPSREYQQVELTNMVEAFNRVMAEVRDATDPGALILTPGRINDMNRQVLKNLDLEEGVVPGEISSHSVVVGAYRGAPRRDCAYLLGRLCDWLERDFAEPNPYAMEDAILKAILAHLYLAWIHPYGDGNGRTARLVELFILCRSGVPAPAAHLLSNHFNDTRPIYYRELAKASQSGGEVVPFLMYAIQGLHDGLVQQLERIRQQTEELVWQRLVHQAIPHHTSAAHRRRVLAIALFNEGKPVSRSGLVVLTPELVNEYAGKSSKTLTRDIHELERVQLIHRGSRGRYIASNDLILGLMPRRAPRI